MTSKKMIQNIALALTIATAGSISLPTLASAKTLDNPKQINLQTTVGVNNNKKNIDATIIKKLSAYVKLNTKTKQFEILPSAYKNLSQNDINFIKESLTYLSLDFLVHFNNTFNLCSLITICSTIFFYHFGIVENNYTNYA